MGSDQFSPNQHFQYPKNKWSDDFGLFNFFSFPNILILKRGFILFFLPRQDK